MSEVECVACGIPLDDDDGEARWLSGEPLCPDCYDAEVGDEGPGWEPDEDVRAVVDVPVGVYL
jgi:hypothetical protein